MRGIAQRGTVHDANGRRPRNLRKSLKATIDLRVPGFKNSVAPGRVQQLFFRDIDSDTWFERFRSTLLEKKGFFPLYRMSDGEFIFTCGRRPPLASQFLHRPIASSREMARNLIVDWRVGFLSGTKETSLEEYTVAEWAELSARYAQRLKVLSEEGILAINLVLQQDQFARQYLSPFCHWLESNEIRVDEDNYFPFYFVYALLLGPHASTVIDGKRVLVVTSLDTGGKEAGIRRTLEKLGAISVEFVSISGNKAMMDRIDLSGLRGSVDLSLIGAGVGALNVLEQLRATAAPAIDAGFVLDCYWDPEKFMGRRVFTMPDAGVAPIRGDGQ